MVSDKEKISIFDSSALLVSRIVESFNDYHFNRHMRSFKKIYGYLPYQDQDGKFAVQHEFMASQIAGELLAVHNLTPNIYEEVEFNVYKFLGSLNFEADRETFIAIVKQNIEDMNVDMNKGRPPFDLVVTRIFDAMNYENKTDSDFILISQGIMNIYFEGMGTWKKILQEYEITQGVPSVFDSDKTSKSDSTISERSNKFPVFSFLGVLFAFFASISMLNHTNDIPLIIGYGITNLSYVLIVATLAGGKFRVFKLYKRSHTFSLAAILFIIGLFLSN